MNLEKPSLSNDPQKATERKDDRKIESAAIRYKGEIYKGKNHGTIYDDLSQWHAINKISFDESALESGFVTSEGEFVNRETGLSIAKEQEQISPEHKIEAEKRGYLGSGDIP